MPSTDNLCGYETYTGYVCVLEKHVGNKHYVVKQYNLIVAPKYDAEHKLIAVTIGLVYGLIVAALILYMLGIVP